MNKTEGTTASLAKLEARLVAMEIEQAATKKANDERIRSLEQQLAAANRRQSDTTATAETLERPAAVHSRRDLLKKGGIGVAAAAAGMAARSPAAAAADGDNLELGSTANVATSSTALTAGADAGANLFLVTGDSVALTADFPAAVAGYGNQEVQSNGLYGVADARTSSTNTGHGVIASVTTYGRSNLLLEPGLLDPRSSGVEHRIGEVIAELDGTLWFCVGGGTPGTWRQLAATDTAGAMHAITPKRVWDSRFQGGTMTDGESRTISVADGRAIGSATVDLPNVVPVGATAVMMNFAVVNTSATGFMAVTPADAAAYTAASVNWYQPNSIVNNGTMTALDPTREVTIWCSGTANFIVDITGYWL